MKRILLALILVSISSASNNRHDYIDSLNRSLDNDAQKDRHVKGFILKREAEKRQLEKSPSTLLDTSKIHEVKVFNGVGYVSIHEYDKDYNNFQERINELEKNQSDLILLISKQSSTQNSKAEDLYNNQEFILKLIEALCALLTVVGGLFGAFKMKKKKE